MNYEILIVCHVNTINRSQYKYKNRQDSKQVNVIFKLCKIVVLFKMMNVRFSNEHKHDKKKNASNYF